MVGAPAGLLAAALVAAVGYGVYRWRAPPPPDPVKKQFHVMGRQWQQKGRFNYSDYFDVLKILDGEGVRHAGPVFEERHLQEFFAISHEDWGIAECQVPHKEDFQKPVAPLVKELGVDGWCHFGWLGGWLSETRTALKMKDWGYVAKKFGNGGLMFTSLLDIRNHPRGWTNGEVTVGPLVNVYDAKLCFDMGWYAPRLSADKINDFEYWNDLGNSECARLRESVPRFDSLTVPEFQKNYVEQTKRLSEGRGGPTKLENEEHEALKCALGGIGGLAPDIANCAYNFCMLEAGYMGQGKQCRENWMPADFSERYQKPS